MDPFGPKALATATVASSLLAYRAVRKKSLTVGGAMTGLMVGFLLVGTGLRGLTLFFFYQLGSWATKYKTATKAAMDETVATASIRGCRQVLAVSLTAVVLSLYHAYRYGPEQPFRFASSAGEEEEEEAAAASTIAAAILAQHAVSLGDTLASELGMASSSCRSLEQQQVRLIIPPFSLVPPGTNGGVTLQGTLWSIVGGLLCGIFTLLMDSISGILPASTTKEDGYLTYNYNYMWQVTLFAGLCGGLGSLLDSILGATVQMTYWDPDSKQVCHSCSSEVNAHALQPASNSSQPRRKHIAGWVPLLSNEGVNFVSVLLTAIMGGWLLAPIVIS